MAVPSPEHLFDQAEKLAKAPRRGAPRQVDLRRAISSAYYGMFHGTLTAFSDEFIGFAERGTTRYALAYRSVDHRSIRELCDEVGKATPSGKYKPFTPAGGWSADILAFAAGLISLQEKRHRADYDPDYQPKQSDAMTAARTARSALARLTAIAAAERKAFLALLAFRPR